MNIVCHMCHDEFETEANDFSTDPLICPRCGTAVGSNAERGADSEKTLIDTRSTLGTILGRFELLEELGAGAFGTVFKAQDTELKRIVALKVPRAGQLANRLDAERFMREARSAANLKHPGIVTLHEVGTVSHSSDVCYLVSEYIAGMTLAERVMTRPYAARAAAELMEQIAQAVGYAHQHGVIHRDLKPANIMIDEAGRPHVLDFGLARSDIEESVLTYEGQILGTPAYMSPEVARGFAHAADQRSDVYSLGVILYQLLTGELPFRGNRRMVILQVLQDDPKAPRSIDDSIPRDLEVITLRCLAKDPAHRYQSAFELSADLQRWLTGSPIHARPVSWVERSWLWSRRNPRIAFLMTAVFALLTIVAVGASVASVHFNRTSIREAESAKNLRIALDKETAAIETANRERALAEAGFREARKAADDFFLRVSEETLLNQPGMHPLRKLLLEDALRYYQSLFTRHADDPYLKSELAVGHHRVADITSLIGSPAEAESAYRSAVALWNDLISHDSKSDSLPHNLARTKLHLGGLLARDGRRRAALIELYEALAIWQELGDAVPNQYGRLIGIGRAQRAIGEVLSDLGQVEESLDRYQLAIDVVERLVRSGVTYQGEGDLNDSSYRILNDLPSTDGATCELAKAYSEGSVHLRQLGRQEQATRWQARAAAMFQTVGADSTGRIDSLSGLANAQLRLSHLQREAGDLQTAENTAEQAISSWASLTEKFPEVSGFRSGYAESRQLRGRIDRELGRLASAHSSLKESIAIWEPLATLYPQVATFKSGLATSHSQLALIFVVENQLDDARAELNSTIALRRDLITRSPDVPRLRSDLADSLLQLGRLRTGEQTSESSYASLNEAAEIWDSLRKQYPRVTDFRSGYAQVQFLLGQWHREQSQASAAVAAYESSLPQYEQLLAESPENLGFKAEKAELLLSLGSLLRETRNFAGAEERCRRAAEILGQIAVAPSENPQWHSECAIAWENVALCALPLNRRADAIDALGRAIAEQKTALQQADLPHFHSALSRHCQFLASAYREVSDYPHAFEFFKLATVHRPPEAQIGYALSVEGAALASAWNASLTELAMPSPPEFQMCRELTLKTLAAAIQAGFSDKLALKTNDVWKVFHDDPEFQKLRAD